jgi:hypothetical protein
VTRRSISTIVAGLSVAALSLVAQVQGVLAQIGPDQGGELVLLSPEAADRTVMVFEGSQARLTDASRERLKEFAELVRRSEKNLKRVLIVGTTIPTGDFSADQDLAIRRAVSARDELIRLSGVRESLVLVQASRSLPGWRAAGQVFIELDTNASTGFGAAHGRVAWDTRSQRWLLVCRDGSIPAARQSAPDDFSALAACQAPGRPAPVASVADGAAAHWDAAASRWVIRCADGSPLPRQENDPDDFHALSRCRR